MKHLRTFENYSMFESKGADMPTKAQVQKEVEGESQIMSKLSKLDNEELEDLLATLTKVKKELKLNESAIYESKELTKKTFMQKVSDALSGAGLGGGLASTVWGAIEMAKAVGPEGAEKIGSLDGSMLPAALAALGVSALIGVVGQLLAKKK